VKFTHWDQLVEMYERLMIHLLSHGIPLGIQVAAFEEAMRRVRKQLYVVQGGARSGRSLVQSSNGREVAQGITPKKCTRACLSGTEAHHPKQHLSWSEPSRGPPKP
jgi:hypothetical protein